METKKVKRKKLNIARTLVLILFIYIIVCFVMYVYKEPVKHYEINGNTLIKDVDILRNLGIDDYPSYVSINTNKLKKKLEKNPLIKKAKVEYGLNFKIKIKIKENKPLFIIKSSNQICLADGTLIDNDSRFVGLPTLLNATPKDIMKILAKNLAEVNDGVLYMISEIEYQPSYNSDNKPIDNNRFLLAMNDKNMVYITAKRAKLLNGYLDIVAAEQVKTNGTLFLDGNEGNYSFKFSKTTTTTTTTKKSGEVDED